MELIKKHYEKIILSIMLLGLVVAAAALPLQVQREKQSLDDLVSGVVRTKPKPFQPLDLTTNQVMLLRFRNPVQFELAGVHNLFNPVPWKKAPDGSLIKIQFGNELGPRALVITKIRELNLNIEYEGVAGSADKRRYRFSVQRETEGTARKTATSATEGGQNEFFRLLKVEGPPESPTEFILQLKSDRRQISIKPGQTFSKVVGYSADLSYPRFKKEFRNTKVKDTIKLEGDPETYKIDAITQNEVVLSAGSTDKRTRIKYNAAQ